MDITGDQSLKKLVDSFATLGRNLFILDAMFLGPLVALLVREQPGLAQIALIGDHDNTHGILEPPLGQLLQPILHTLQTIMVVDTTHQQG